MRYINLIMKKAKGQLTKERESQDLSDIQSIRNLIAFHILPYFPIKDRELLIDTGGLMDQFRNALETGQIQDSKTLIENTGLIEFAQYERGGTVGTPLPSPKRLKVLQDFLKSL